MTQPIKNTVNVIDSRDVIARIEELEAERNALVFNKEEAENQGTPWDTDTRVLNTQKALEDFDSREEGQELTALKKLAGEAENTPDWVHGETLINEDYFTRYIEELIGDCYELPKKLNSGEWPWRHMKMDYAAAADEARQDYMEVDFNGTTFLIRA